MLRCLSVLGFVVIAFYMWPKELIKIFVSFESHVSRTASAGLQLKLSRKVLPIEEKALQFSYIYAKRTFRKSKNYPHWGKNGWVMANLKFFHFFTRQHSHFDTFAIITLWVAIESNFIYNITKLNTLLYHAKVSANLILLIPYSW